jgi:hypothetical protein
MDLIALLTIFLLVLILCRSQYKAYSSAVDNSHQKLTVAVDIIKYMLQNPNCACPLQLDNSIDRCLRMSEEDMDCLQCTLIYINDNGINKYSRENKLSQFDEDDDTTDDGE